MPPDAGSRPPSVVPEVGISGQSQSSEVERVHDGCPRWPVPGGMAWGS